MLLVFPGILNADEVEKIRRIGQTGEFVDGAISAPALGRKGVKKNEQLRQSSKKQGMLTNLVFDALRRDETLQIAAVPQRYRVPLLSRYTPGMHYGTHVDMPVVDLVDPMRLDLSMTIFVNGPEDYDGGELILNTGYGEQTIKLPAGDAVMYPTNMLHRVNEVTRGERLVVITWIQSMVRDQEKRSILYELAQVTQWASKVAPESDPYHMLANARANLVRIWATD